MAIQNSKCFYRFLFYILFLIVLSSCKNGSKKINLVSNQKSDFTIVVSSVADSLTKKAATELKYYIKDISNVELNIVNNISSKQPQIIIGKELIKNLELLSEIENLNEDGFIIDTKSGNIVISGKNAKTNQYATFTFIEEFLGCRLLTKDEEFIPRNKTISIPKIKKVYEPAFDFRRILFPGLHSLKFKAWHKIENLDEWGSFVHTFDDLISPDKYFESNPEYFSLIGNNRLSDAQLCLSNPEVIETLKQNLRKEIEKKPNKKYWSVSQNDCINYCECKGCKALYDKYESYSGAYIFMSNELAKEFPDKHISTLAYQFTRSAPKNIIPLKNVNIMFCSIECNRSMPLADDERSDGFVNDMKNWSALTNNIFVWDYVVQFKNYLTPFPNFKVLQPNIQFFKENNVNMMFQQGSNKNWSDMIELKQYLIAKLLWDPDINVDSIVNDFLVKYYGPAEPYIKSYFDLTHTELEKHKESEFLNIYGFPSNYFDSYLTPSLLKEYRSLMDKAEASVQNDSVYLKRVLKARLPVDFAYIDIAMNKRIGEISFIGESNEGKFIRPEMKDYLNRFIEISNLTGVTYINERNFHTKDYKKYVENKLNQMIKKNIAKNKNVKCLTLYSEKYPVGGEKALIDGLFGDLDFNNNWLGFEGNDMIVTIDLLEPEKVNKLSMNFLKAVNSWIFLPEEIIVESSDDGKNYSKVATVKGDNSDRRYLVKSIPFNIELDNIATQHLKIKAISMKKCPEWHRGFGNPSWIFIDEIIIE